MVNNISQKKESFSVKKPKKGYKKRSQKISNLSEEETEKEQQYGCKQYKNFPENEKQRLVEYKKNYFEMWKNTSQ